MEEGNEDAYRKQLLEMQKARQAEAQTRELLKQLLSPEAYERMMNIRLANPELYQQLVQLLVYLRQQSGSEERISEEKLKSLVSRIISRRRETVIKRR